MAANYSKKIEIHFFHVWLIWLARTSSATNETHTKWKFEQFATSGDLVCLSMDKHGASRQDLMFAIGDIYIVNQWFLKKKHQKPQLRTHFSRKN